MEQQDLEKLDLKSKIINVFHPIQQLFRIMSKQSEGIHEDVTRSCAEVGLELCSSFRIKIDALLTTQEQE